MDIHQLSANIDAKLVQLEEKLKQLKEQQNKSTDVDAKLTESIDALEQLKIKLLKSREVAWQAYELREDTQELSSNNYRTLGLALCVFSGLGLLAILVSFILR
jgi:hypothetical protein